MPPDSPGAKVKLEDPPGGVPVPIAERPRTHLTKPTAGPKQTQGAIVDGYPFIGAPPSDAGSRYPFLLPAEEPDEIGRLGSYRVLRLLGTGGMGYVFLAQDLDLGRPVALKVMKPDLDGDPSAWQRFLREARTLAAIKHEHLVTVFQVGQEGRAIYLAMEWLQGETIEAWVAKAGSAKLPDLLRIGREIAAGLAAIHQQGVVHRDIKPGNLWLEQPRQHVKILDFGLARPMDDDANFTQSGIIVGTPAFMSPEQARGDRIDARSDLFSLGGVLYFMATGARPFQADNTIALLTALAICDPRPPHERNHALPRSLSQLIMRLLDKNPDRRPSSAHDVIAELNRIERNPTADPKTEEVDFASFVLPSEASARSTKTHKVRPNRRSLKWGVTIGLSSALVAGLGVALVAAMIGGAPATPTTTAARQKEPPPKTQPAKQKSTAIPVASAQSKTVFLIDLNGLSDDWLKEPPGPPRDRDDGPFGGPPPKKDGPFGGPPRPFDGVRVNGKLSPHGIFMHPPLGPDGGVTRIRYVLDNQYDRFEAEVSLNDGPPRSYTPLKFAVYGNNNERLWQTRRDVQTQNDIQACSISIKNVDVLTIEVNCPGEPISAHAVWIEPRVIKNK